MIEIDLSWIDNEKLQNHMKKIIEDFFSLQKWLVLEAMGHKINPVVFSFVVNTITLEITHHIIHSTITSQEDALEVYLNELLMKEGENNEKEVKE